MLYNYIKLALRNFAKNKIFVTINILGLGISIACCIVAFLNWQYNADFDAVHEHGDEIYRVNFVRTVNNQGIQNGSCPAPLGEIIRTSLGQVSQTARVQFMGGNFRVNDQLFRTSISTVDEDFFRMFTFQFLMGDPFSISDQRTILISEELHEKYFPNVVDPIGNTLTYLNGDARVDFKVGGVFKKPPQNSSFYAMAYINYDNTLDLMNFDTDDWASFNSTFVRLPNASDVSSVEKSLNDYVEIQNRAKEDYKVDYYYLDKFPGMAVRAEREGTWNHWFANSLPTAAAVAPGIMAFLLLLIACFNFTNTSIAIANRRIKEIGIRKVMGSDRSQLVKQFLGENILLTFIALIVGVLLAAFLVPAYNAMWPFLEIKLSLSENGLLWGFLIVLLVLTGLAAGSYPAFYVSGFHPTTIFRGTTKFSGTNILTRILLTLQFAISLVAIISGFVFSENARFQAAYDLGFSPSEVVYAYLNDPGDYQAFRNELMNSDLVESIAGSQHQISSSWYTDPIKYEGKELDVEMMNVGDGYLATIGATLSAGRVFKENSEYDRENAVIVNEEFVRSFDIENPLDARVTYYDTSSLQIVGVVKDIYLQGALWDPIEPLMLKAAAPEEYRFISVQTAGENAQALKGFMDQKWKTLFPDQISTVTTLDEESAGSRLTNQNIKTLFVFLGVVAFLLSVFGLFSLVSLNLNKRMRELGIRKVLGANTLQLLLRIAKEFIMILLIACVLGSVLGYFLSNALMESIWAVHTDITVTIFMISISLMLIVSLITIGGRIVKATSVAPATIIGED